MMQVWVVIRMCTNDDAVVEFWNSIDANLELEMDVLDDLSGEAQEIHKFNPFFTYSEGLHRLREWCVHSRVPPSRRRRRDYQFHRGTTSKILDRLDEAALSATQIFELAALVLGQEYADVLPHPELEAKAILGALASAQAGLRLVWDPLDKKRKPHFDVNVLSKMINGKMLNGGTSKGCTLS